MRGPLQFGFAEIADVTSYRDAAKDNREHPSGVERSREKLTTRQTRMMRWPGSEPFLMWGHQEGPEEATPERHRTDCAISMLERFAKSAQPWHLEVHYIQPHYYALTEQLDAQVGRLLKALDRTGQADNTMVVFTTATCAAPTACGS